MGGARFKSSVAHAHEQCNAHLLPAVLLAGLVGFFPSAFTASVVGNAYPSFWFRITSCCWLILGRSSPRGVRGTTARWSAATMGLNALVAMSCLPVADGSGDGSSGLSSLAA